MREIVALTRDSGVVHGVAAAGRHGNLAFWVTLCGKRFHKWTTRPAGPDDRTACQLCVGVVRKQVRAEIRQARREFKRVGKGRRYVSSCGRVRVVRRSLHWVLGPWMTYVDNKLVCEWGDRLREALDDAARRLVAIRRGSGRRPPT